MELSIENGGTLYSPIVEEGVTLEWTLEGVPGKLTFKVVNDNRPDKMAINIQEGDAVRFIVDDVKLFYGFVFTKKRDKEQIISITAYDQLRYLKNKDSKLFKKMKASEVISTLANDFLLQCGDIEDTGHVIPILREDNKTLFDMIKDALDETLINKNKIYVLYDDFGKLTLKNIQNMTLDYILYSGDAVNFDYQSSIDGETYNQIKLVYENEEEGCRNAYIAKDSGNIQKWGLLQYYGEVKNPDIAEEKVNSMLSMYNSKRRTLTVSDALGDLRVRAGSRIIVNLVLGDVDANTYMIVDSVKHKFKGDEHLMDLTLRSGIFV